MEPVSLKQLLAATNGRAVGFDRPAVEFPAVTLNSRTVRGGELFWAVQGDTHNGHHFAAEAIRHGAAACVVQADHSLSITGPTVVVPNSLQALWQFAGWYRAQHRVRIVGVTGSVGKTTTREMIDAVLSQRFAGRQSPGNFNNHFGVPLSLLRIDRHHEFAVLELAASRLGEIGELAAIASPQVGVITGIGPAHLSGFGTEENILQAKGELLEALPRDGLAVLAGDDPRLRKLAHRADCPVVMVGEGPHNEVRAEAVQIARNQIRFAVDGTRYEVTCTGRHHVTAALTAIAIGRQWGMSPTEIAEGLRTFVPVPGRCRVEQIGPWTVIDDTYNANPASVKAACDTLAAFDTPGRKLLVVGDMRELGPQAADWHHAVGQWASESTIDYLVAVGQYAEHVGAGALAAGIAPGHVADCPNVERLLQVLKDWLQPGDVLLVKGSRAMHMEQVITWLREHSVTHEEGNSHRVAARAGV